MGKKYKTGLAIMRVQPLHIGHENVICKMLSECDVGVILVGSANAPLGNRNPFTADQRVQMIRNIFADDNLQLGKIDDLGNSKLWAGYVLAEVWKNLRAEVDAYYCGVGQDGDLFRAHGLSVIEMPRDEIPISATEIRNRLAAGDKEVLKYVHRENKKLVTKILLKKGNKNEK